MTKLAAPMPVINNVQPNEPGPGHNGGPSIDPGVDLHEDTEADLENFIARLRASDEAAIEVLARSFRVARRDRLIRQTWDWIKAALPDARPSKIVAFALARAEAGRDLTGKIVADLDLSEIKRLTFDARQIIAWTPAGRRRGRALGERMISKIAR